MQKCFRIFHHIHPSFSCSLLTTIWILNVRLFRFSSRLIWMPFVSTGNRRELCDFCFQARKQFISGMFGFLAFISGECYRVLSTKSLTIAYVLMYFGLNCMFNQFLEHVLFVKFKSCLNFIPSNVHENRLTWFSKQQWFEALVTLKHLWDLSQSTMLLFRGKHSVLFAFQKWLKLCGTVHFAHLGKHAWQ